MRYMAPLGLLLIITGCTLPLVWGNPDPVEEPGPSVTPGLAMTLAGTPLPPTAVATPAPTEPPMQTPTLDIPTATPAPTRLPFILQPGAPEAGVNFTHPELECNWFGVAGHVLDIDRNPIDGILVEVRGEIAGDPVQALAMTGTAPLYGPGGFEIQLGDAPVSTDGTLNIQVFDMAGDPISEIFAFDTYGDCDKNLVLITFIEAPDFIQKRFMPAIFE